MTIAQLAAYVRWKAGVDNISPYDNASLLPVFNFAKNRVAQAIAQINPNYFSATEVKTTIANTNIYAKPSDLLLLKRLELSYRDTNPDSYRVARPVTQAQMKLSDSWFAQNASISDPLYRDEGVNYVIYPTVTAATAGAMFYKLWYVPYPPDFTDLGSTSAIQLITGIGPMFDEIIGEFVVLSIKGKQDELTQIETRKAQVDLLDTLVPAAFQQLSTIESNLPSFTNLEN